MKETNEQRVADAFESVFDEIGDATLKNILNALNAFPIRNPGLVIKHLHEMALSENAYRNQFFADQAAEQFA
jgi:hypothetical protein